MSYSGQTTHYGIPLPTSSDLVNLLDWNQSSEDIDTALYGAAQAASDAGTEIVGIKATLVQLENADVQFQSDLNAIDGRVTSLEQTSGNIEEDVEDIADMITAKEVPTAQSDQRILVGEWFRYNGVLYVCTVQIEIGDTIVPNVNCRATNIETEMAAGGGGVEIDDTTTSASKVWSSQKTSNEIGNATSVKTGDVRFSNGKLQQYNGSAWVDVQIGGSMQKNFTFYGEKADGTTYKPFYIDISELDDTDTISISCQYSNATITEVVTVSTAKGWTTAHKIMPTTNIYGDILYENGKLKFYASTGYPIQWWVNFNI